MSKNKIIVNFFKAVQSKDVASIVAEGNLLLSYLQKYSGSYKSNGLLAKILMVEWEQKHIVERDKAIVQSLRNYISFLLELVKKNDTCLNAYISNIKTALTDFKPTICRLDGNLDFEFSIGNTNIQQTGMQYKIIEALFYSNILPEPVSKYDLDHIVVPFLRTVVESKIKSVLGIDILRNNKNQAIDLSEILDILPKLKSIKLDKAYDVSIISLIMKWLNHFMHRNIRPEPYILHQVLQYLKPIFQAGEIKYPDGILFSINSSAFADDSEAFHLEVESLLNTKFPQCIIEWKRKEIATIKQNKL